MSVSLVIMAAGLGSRYGGSKQVDGIGPNGEILMEYSIHDALRAGFDKVVFIIKPEMQEMMDGLVGYLKNKKTARSICHAGRWELCRSSRAAAAAGTAENFVEGYSTSCSAA